MIKILYSLIFACNLEISAKLMCIQLAYCQFLRKAVNFSSLSSEAQPCNLNVYRLIAGEEVNLTMPLALSNS
jgi:hypothetical protein